MKTNNASNRKQKSRLGMFGWVAVVAVGGLAAGSLFLFNTSEPAKAQPPIPSGYALDSWQDNGASGKYLLEVADGKLPAAGEALSGVVMTDTNCMPDEEGLSHCVNEIRFADGSSLTVVDNHNMGVNRCL